MTVLTDSLGRKIDFKNTIIIMTSNVGARQLKDFGQGVGFGTLQELQMLMIILKVLLKMR
jgi:ATP-dependent Clp protease ATP-binding subunit ClpC